MNRDTSPTAEIQTLPLPGGEQPPDHHLGGEKARGCPHPEESSSY